jgi:hypothetical protein
MVKVADSILKKVEKENLGGITSVDLLAFFADQEIRFGEATLRKWVQLGLLPRSVRVGRKGKHQGSKGKYPVRVLRRILRIKELMAKNLTIEEIQRQILFVRGDIEELEHTLERVFLVLDRVMGERDGKLASVRAASADLSRARGMARDLIERLERVEGRLAADEDERSESVAS